nr:MAG TPA: transmembrane protein [Caudoviricetes sp.]
MEKFLKLLCKLLNCAFLVFVALRACDVVDWAWYQVFIPAFIRGGLAVAAVALR